MIMQTLKKTRKYIFWFFVLPLFQKKHKIKYNKVGIVTTFLLMMKIRKAKALNKFTSVSGGTKGFFKKKHKTTNKHFK